MKTKSRFVSSLVAPWGILIAIFAASVGSAFAQKLETIALYDFINPEKLFADASGNARHLSNPAGVSQSTTEYSSVAPTTVSAYFNGTQNGANRQINFSLYPALTFDWYMKADPADLQGDITTRVLLQTAWQEDVSGAFSFYVKNVDGNIVLRAIHRMSSGWAWANFLLDDLSSWNNYTLSVDNAKAGADHISLLINGIAQEAIPGSTYYSATMTGAFVTADQYTFLGNNNAKNRPFVGYLQNFEIYSGTPTPVPEPASVALLIGLAGTAFAFVTRRRC